MSVEKVRNDLSTYGFGDRVMEFAVSSATVELAAVAVGTEPARIAKSLTFYGKDGECLMIVTAGDQKIDNAKYKAAFGCKAKMMSAEDAQRMLDAGASLVQCYSAMVYEGPALPGRICRQLSKPARIAEKERKKAAK